MRIALISSNSCPVPAIRGGSIQILNDGIKDFLARENGLTVYSIADPDLPRLETREGVRYVRYPKDSYLAGITADLRQRSGEFDLVHTFNRPRYIPQIKEASPRSRIVLSLHNDLISPKLMSKSDGLAVIQAADRILAISGYLAKTLVKRFGAAAPKVKIWYSGVDVAHLRPVWTPEGKDIREKLRRQYGLEGKKVLLFSGRILRKKGVHVLLQAFLLLAHKINDLVLVILGGGKKDELEENAYLRTLYELSKPVEERVIFAGFIRPSELHPYYLAADIFVCPSQWQEPLGRVHYEAMAAGTPIITMNRGGIPEVVQDGINGVVVHDYWNPKALARAVKMLLEHPEKALAMAKRGRQIAEEKFSFERVAGELLRHYREMSPVAGSSRKT